MFGAIEDAIERVKAIDYIDGFSFVLLIPENKELIPELIQEQLWSGVDGTGTELEFIGGQYTPFTIVHKRRKGLPIDRVTLFQNGVFYQSIEVRVDKEGWTVEFDPIKDGVDLQKRWGDKLVDLTDESVVKLIDQIANDYVDWLVSQIIG